MKAPKPAAACVVYKLNFEKVNAFPK